jgi:hypothetical protein
MDKRKPPQLMASFISKQACDVAYWHLAKFAALHHFGRYRRKADIGLR